MSKNNTIKIKGNVKGSNTVFAGDNNKIIHLIKNFIYKGLSAAELEPIVKSVLEIARTAFRDTCILAILALIFIKIIVNRVEINGRIDFQTIIVFLIVLFLFLVLGCIIIFIVRFFATYFWSKAYVKALVIILMIPFCMAISIVSASYLLDEPIENIIERIVSPSDKDKPVSYSAKKSRYSLRSKPITVSQEEFKKVFGLNENLRPLEYLQNEFEDNRDGTITDHATGLMWQKSGSPNRIYLKDVPAYIEKLNSEMFAGYSDWRLPTVDEPKSLLTPEKQSNVYIDPIFDKTLTWCWTSDQLSSGGSCLVAFNGGLVGFGYLNYDGIQVRAVRSRQ